MKLNGVIKELDNYGVYHYISSTSKGRIWIMPEDDTDLMLMEALLSDWGTNNFDFHKATDKCWVLVLL